MKNLKVLAILVLSGTVLSSPVFSQKNVTKIGAFPGALTGMYTLSQERAINERMSIQTTFRFMPSRSNSFVDQSDNVTYQDEQYDPFKNPKLSGFGNFTELKIYKESNGALNGFYWGPYVHFTTYTVKSEKDYYEDYDSDGNLYYGDAQMTLKMSNIGLGLMIGTQKVFGNGITLDWTILGLGFNSIGFKGVVEATNTSNNFDFRNYQEDFNEAEFEIEKYFPLTMTAEKERAVITSTRLPFVQFRMGLTIGFGY